MTVSEAEAIVRLWRTKLEADELAIGQSTEARERAEAHDLSVPGVKTRIEVFIQNEDGSWEVKPKWVKWNDDKFRKMKLAAAAPQVVSMLHHMLHEVAPGDPQWQDDLVAAIKEIGRRNETPASEMGGMERLMAEGLVLTGDDAVAAALFDKEWREAGETSSGELEVYSGHEKVMNGPEGITFPKSQLDWRTGKPDEEKKGFDLRFNGNGEHGSDFGEHVVIAGMSGAGKTATTQTIILKLAEAGKQVIVIDAGDRAQHRNLADVLAGVAEVTTIRFDDPDAPVVQLGLFTPEPGVSMDRHINQIKQVLLFATDAQEPFPQIIESALRNLMAKHGHSVRMSDGTWSVASAEPTTPEFSEFIAEALAYTKVYKGGTGVGGDVSGFLQTRLEAIQNSIGQHLGSENLLNIANLYDKHKVVHIDVSGMDPDNRKLIETLVQEDYATSGDVPERKAATKICRLTMRWS